jgi:thioredoxin-related protein
MEAARSRGLELLVFEHPDCVYCRVFRRDILPAYQRTMAALPIRFIDIQWSDTKGMGLKTRIDQLPTAVLMKDGAEFDRIAGYWGPANFFKLLAHMRARAE